MHNGVVGGLKQMGCLPKNKGDEIEAILAQQAIEVEQASDSEILAYGRSLHEESKRVDPVQEVGLFAARDRKVITRRNSAPRELENMVNIEEVPESVSFRQR